MAGYIAKSGTDISKVSEEGLLYCKTNIGGYFFDGFMRVDHSSELEVTQHQVETGSSIVDHSYLKPKQVVMEIIVSDAHDSIIPGQFGQGRGRHVEAWNILKQIQSDRIPVSVFTKLGLYDNMLITSLSASDDYSTYHSLVATVTLREVPVAMLKTVSVLQVNTSEAHISEAGVLHGGSGRSIEEQIIANNDRGSVNAQLPNDVDRMMATQYFSYDYTYNWQWSGSN